MIEESMAKKQKQQLKNQKKGKNLIGFLGLLVLIIVAFTIVEFENNDITKDMKKQTSVFLEQAENEYLVYMYDGKKCSGCDGYKKDLKGYQETKSGLPMYNVKTGELDEAVVDDELFIDSRYPTIIHVMNGKEKYRYVGTFPIKELPTNGGSKQGDQ